MSIFLIKLIINRIINLKREWITRWQLFAVDSTAHKREPHILNLKIFPIIWKNFIWILLLYLFSKPSQLFIYNLCFSSKLN